MGNNYYLITEEVFTMASEDEKREALMRMQQAHPQAGPTDAQRQQQQQQAVQLRDMRPQLRETVSKEQVQAETVARRTWDMFINAIG